MKISTTSSGSPLNVDRIFAKKHLQNPPSPLQTVCGDDLRNISYKRAKYGARKRFVLSCNNSSSELPYCGEAACAQRERIQRRAERDLHVRVQPDRPRLREEDPWGGAQAVPTGYSHLIIFLRKSVLSKACFCKTSFGKQFVLLLSTRWSLEQPQVIDLFRLFFRSIPNWNFAIWQKTMTLFTGWLDQPGIFLLLDKSRRSHRQVIIFLLEIKLRSSVFSIFGNCQSCILLISFCAHIAGISFTCAPSVVNFKLFCPT